MSRFGLVLKRVKKPEGTESIVPYSFMLNDCTSCMIFRKNLQLFIYDMTNERWYEIVHKKWSKDETALF